MPQMVYLSISKVSSNLFTNERHTYMPLACAGNTKLPSSLLRGNNIVQVNLYVSRWSNRTLFWHMIFIIVIKHVWAQIPGARSLGCRRTCRYMWHNIIYRSYNDSMNSLIAFHCVVWNLWRYRCGTTHSKEFHRTSSQLKRFNGNQRTAVFHKWTAYLTLATFKLRWQY